MITKLHQTLSWGDLGVLIRIFVRVTRKFTVFAEDADT